MYAHNNNNKTAAFLIAAFTWHFPYATRRLIWMFGKINKENRKKEQQQTARGKGKRGGHFREAPTKSCLKFGRTRHSQSKVKSQKNLLMQCVNISARFLFFRVPKKQKKRRGAAFFVNEPRPCGSARVIGLGGRLVSSWLCTESEKTWLPGNRSARTNRCAFDSRTAAPPCQSFRAVFIIIILAPLYLSASLSLTISVFLLLK